MQEYKLIDKFDGYKLLDRNGQVIYVQTDDVKKQLSLGNVRIYGLKLSESGRLLKETPEEIKEWQRQQQEQIKQQQLLEKQRQEQIEEEHARQLKASLQWEGTLFGVPLDEFKAEFGGRSYGIEGNEGLLLLDMKYGNNYESQLMLSEVYKVNNFAEYRSGIVRVYDPDRQQYIPTEYYIALANRLWHEELSKTDEARQYIINKVEQMSKKHRWFRLLAK